MNNERDEMKEAIINIMKAGLHGKHTHVDPIKSIRGLDADKARLSPAEGSHSSWGILYHIVKWQDATVEALRGNEVNWKEVSATDWPTDEEMAEDAAWIDLGRQFEAGLANMEQLIETSEPDGIIPDWNIPYAGAALMILQHNSYHLGQIVTVRQATGTWPPPS
jgi:hypothetical protein